MLNKQPVVESTKIRQSAKGESCAFRIPAVCTFDPEQTVFCHAPAKGYRGMGKKGPDIWGAYGCSSCHNTLDEHKLSRLEELEYWDSAKLETIMKLIQKGLVEVK